MAGFTILILKIAFLAILWLFIVVVAVVVNQDLPGGRKSRKAAAGVPADAVAGPTARTNPSRRRRGGPWILAIDSGDRAGERLQLVPEVHIGRSDQCELNLNDDFVSARHALLRRLDDGSWVLTDTGSTNGTFVNTRRITSPTVVTPSDIIRIGDVQLRLEQA